MPCRRPDAADAAGHYFEAARPIGGLHSAFPGQSFEYDAMLHDT